MTSDRTRTKAFFMRRDGSPFEKANSEPRLVPEIVPEIVAQHPRSTKPATQSLSIPPELANYSGHTIVKELGRGGMGVVYLAKNIQLDRLEVLKVLNERLLDHAGAKERFLREIRAVSKLNHPNIVTSYSILPLDGLMVFAMEHVPGMDLHQFVQKYQPLPIGLACRLARHIANGLQHAHERGLVHRDIKPSNAIVFKGDGQFQAKILDFGLAKAGSEESLSNLTQDGTMLGTPEYMSPEQTLNAAKADIRADVYSLGCTLYFMLTCKAPFSGTHGEVLMAHARSEAPPVSQIRPEIPEELAAVIARMIAKQPESRFQTPAEVSEALSPFLDLQKVAATTGGQPKTPMQPEQRDAPQLDSRSLAPATQKPVVAHQATEPSPHRADPWSQATKPRDQATAPEREVRREVVDSTTNDAAETSARRRWTPSEMVIALAVLLLAASGLFSLFSKIRDVVTGSDSGVELLFNGSKLRGLSPLKPQIGGWRIEDGLLIVRCLPEDELAAEDARQSFQLRLDRELSDFRLRFTCVDWKRDGRAAVVLFRIKEFDNPATTGQEGYGMDIGGLGPRERVTLPAGRVFLLKNTPRGQRPTWQLEHNEITVDEEQPVNFELTVIGDQITAKVNDEVVADLSDDTYSSGIFQFAFRPGSETRFSKIELEDLSSASSPQDAPSVD